MATQPTPEERRTRFHELITDFRFGMLVSRGSDGAPMARPMSVAKIDDDGTIYFGTGVSSEKVAEVTADPRVAVTFQGKTSYAVVTGSATLSRDRELIDELWQADWKLWWPEGKDDPEVSILIVSPEHGEYWDQRGTKGVSFVLRAVKAAVTGSQVENDPEAHGKVELGG